MPTEMYALDYNNTYSEGTIASPVRQRVSEAEYWEKYYDYPDVTYEWNDGYLEEKAVSTQATYLTHEWLTELLTHFLRTKAIAQITGLEMGFRLVLPNKLEIRRPDLGLVLNSNPVPLLADDRSYKGTFDLCVEAISDSTKQDIERDTKDKKIGYAKAGVKEYYILDGHDRYMEFYRLGSRGVYIPIKPVKGIIKSKVLPGFQFRASDLLQKLSPDDMITDPVYKGFVLPGYSKAIEQAEDEKRARQKAEQRALEAQAKAQAEQSARQTAEVKVQAEQSARQKAEAEIARLMALLANKKS
jgi:hypothetical protein